MTPTEPIHTADFPTANTLHRAVKMALDTGEVGGVKEAYDLFRTYRLGVALGPEVGSSAAHQAALLTIVNTGRRALLGGVFVAGNADVPLLVVVPGAESLAEAIRLLGGQIVEKLPASVPTLSLGSVKHAGNGHACALAVTFRDWRGGVIPVDEKQELDIGDSIIPAAILAGALGVSEVFQHLRGNPMAGRRVVGMSLWSPSSIDWQSAPSGPLNIVLPSRLWLIGLGHLGQAYLWVLGLLPYRKPDEVMLVLQDFDTLQKSNDSTSLLTDAGLIGNLKTRAMADWAELRGFRTKLVERRFPGGLRIANDEPRLALGGVDNPQARAAYEDAGFDWIVEAGLGNGPIEYLAIRLHTFPASTSARSKWDRATGDSDRTALNKPAYEQLSAVGMDECGLVQLSSRSVGVPFVGAVTATLVIAEVLRQLNGGSTNEIIDMSLRDLALRDTVPASNNLTNFNPGYTT